MTSSLKQKTVTGLIWSFAENLAVQGVHFLIGIVLAWLLDPTDFGLIGMMTIFISISQWFISSGLGHALIRKQNCSQADYSTVFFFNLFSGIILYAILFFLAPFISVFFEEPQLSLLIKIFGLNLIIISLSIVQQTQLSKRLDFKLQTKITAFSAVVSGIVGITLAYCGFGVWSLIYKSVIEYSLRSVLLWFMNNWKPSFVFSKKSFSELFGFGFKLMLRGLIYSVFNNIYYAVIGKYYSTAELGYYTRAEQFSNLPSHNINKVVDRVTYPALSVLQNDKKELKRAYRKVFLTLVYITSTLMITLGALAEPVILSLIGEKWENSIEMLQYLCFIGLLYPLCDFNLTILKIVGKSSTILWLEIIKRLFTIPVIIVGVLLGIKFLLIGIIIVSVIEFLVNGFFSGRYIDYPIQEQLKDNMANIFLAIFLGVAVYSFSYLIGFSPVLNLVLSGVFAILIVLFCSELFKIQGYINIKEIVKERFGKSRNSK